MCRVSRLVFTLMYRDVERTSGKDWTSCRIGSRVRVKDRTGHVGTYTDWTGYVRNGQDKGSGWGWGRRTSDSRSLKLQNLKPWVVRLVSLPTWPGRPR